MQESGYRYQIPETTEQKNIRTRAVVSLAWQNLLKRWMNDPDISHTELKQILQDDIHTDLAQTVPVHTIPFLEGTTRKQDIAEYKQFIQGTLTDLAESYIIKERLIPSRHISSEADVDKDYYIDG
jgi:hypothetical protein